MAHLASGGGWDTTITAVNTTMLAVPVQIVLHGDDGNLFAVSSQAAGFGISQSFSNGTVSEVVPPNTSLVITIGLRSDASITTGWAELLSTTNVPAFAIFRYTNAAGNISEGTATLQTNGLSRIYFAFDNTNGFSTGIAVANLLAGAGTFAATVLDQNGAQISNNTIAIPGNGHTSFVLTDKFPSVAGKRGLVMLQSGTAALSAVGLQATPSLDFTSLPSIPGQ